MIGSFFNPLLPGGTAASMNVDFSASTQSSEIGATISFTNLSTPTPIFNFWDFGDGSFSTASAPDKVYSSLGTFSVTLNACDNISGGIETKSDYIFITFDPSDISDLDIWIDGDDVNSMSLSGNNITSISDKSSRNETFSADGTVELDTTFITGRNLIKFTSGNLRTSALYPYHKSTEKTTFFIVYYLNGSSAVHSLFDNTGGSSTNIGMFFFHDNRTTSNANISLRTSNGSQNPVILLAGNNYSKNDDWVVLEFSIDNSQSQGSRGRLNSDNSNVFNTDTGNTNTFSSSDQSRYTTIGGFSAPTVPPITGLFDGYIAEVISYKKILTSDEKTLIYNYLNSKWSL